MRSRPPWILYVVTLASVGYFSFVWVIMLMRDINQLAGRPIFPVRMISWGFGLGLTFYLGGFVLLTFDLMPERAALLVRLMVTLIVTLFVSSFLSLAFVSRYITKASGADVRVRDLAFVIVLSFLWLLSFPIVQRDLNKLLTGHRS